MIRKALHTIAVLLFLTGLVAAQDYQILHVDKSYQNLAAATTAVPPAPTPLENVTDTLSDYSAGETATEQIGFLYPTLSDKPPGLSNGRQIVITYPQGFGLTAISTVTVSDTDPAIDAPELESATVYSRTVVLRFKQDIPDFAPGTYLYVTLDAVVNPTEARQYAVTVRLDNRHGQTIAGPTLSDWFEITAGPPTTLTIFPTGDTTLHAGEGIAFTAFITDRFGNRIESAQAQWMLDPTMDTIGTFFGSFLQATTVGTGRVIAKADTLEAYSGEITVTSGDAAAIIVMGGADPVMIGQPLSYDISLEIQDRFGNRKNDYLGSVWFTSDDPLAEIAHDETNPYQFTAADAGRAVFSGDQFVFGTAGARILTATDGTLSGSTYVYILTGGGPVNFDISIPATALAGNPFDITVTNAVDSAGDPYNGMILTLGGNISPDGTAPIVPEIEIVDGQGIGHATLYGAGRNTLVFYSGSSAVQKNIIVSPGSLASLDLNIDRTQFIGNPFRGDASIQAFDEFRNPKSDFSGLGIDIELTSPTGVLTPDIIHPEQFDLSGAADLSTYRYDGRPGLATVTASVLGVSPAIETSEDMVANGIYAEIDPRSGLPEWMPSGWTFDLRGESWNPADLTPVQIEYTAGFVGGDSPSPIVQSTTGCLPQAGMIGNCRFAVHQEAGETAGDYTYEFRISALYNVQGEEITAVWVYSTDISIVPFVPFSVRADDLPDVALQANYIVPGMLTLIDNNDYDIDAKARFSVVGISKDTTMYWLSHTSFPFLWNAETPVDIDMHFGSPIPTGHYDYLADILASMYGPNDAYRVDYSESYPLDKTIDIIPRSQLAVDTLSIMPDRVPVGASIEFSFDLDLTGTTDIVLNGKQSTLTPEGQLVHPRPGRQYANRRQYCRPRQLGRKTTDGAASRHRYRRRHGAGRRDVRFFVPCHGRGFGRRRAGVVARQQRSQRAVR